MRRALTIVDVLVALAAAVLLVAALVPSIARLRALGGESISFANLQTLSFAHALYGWTWNDRQVTWVPDDAGIYTSQTGNTNWYLGYVQGGAGCPPPFLVGWDTVPYLAVWGYFLPCGAGATYGTAGNFVTYQPCNFTVGNVYGAFRLPNSLAFHNYVGGRFYDPAFYTPTDTKTWEWASYGFPFEGTFGKPPPLGQPGNPSIVFSSYCLSPAAMWGPEVFSFNGQTGAFYKAPWISPTGYQSPTVSQCLYPDLKTRMLEHNWNVGQPAATNPAFAGGITPYFFNQGITAAPVTLFFDGHIQALSNAHVVADDGKVLAGSGGAVGLWTRDTPLGANGYYGAQSYDGTLVSHHILTTDGILGRDVLTTTPASPVGSPHDGRDRSTARRKGSSSGSAAGAAHSPRTNPSQPWHRISPPMIDPIGVPLE